MMKVGDWVTLKGKKTRAKVTKVLDLPHRQNNWDGWVEISPALGGFTRWSIDDLEPVVRWSPSWAAITTDEFPKQL
jgi:hypothetical protein